MSPNFVSDISKISILLPNTSLRISNLFLIGLIFKWAIMIRFGFFWRISFNASFFSVSLDLVPFSWFMADLSDFSVYPKLAKDLKFTQVSKHAALWKLSVTRQVVTNFLIPLIKLIQACLSLLDLNVTLLVEFISIVDDIHL